MSFYNGHATLQFSQDHKLELFLDIDQNENILNVFFKCQRPELETYFEELKKATLGKNIHDLSKLPDQIFYPHSFLDPISTLFYQAVDNFTGREINQFNIRSKDKMICQCFGLTETEVLSQLKSKISLSRVKSELKASTNCGNCTKGIERLLSNDDFRRNSLRKEKELCTCFHLSFRYLSSYIYAQKTFETQNKKKPVLAGTACDFCHCDLNQLGETKEEVGLLQEYGNKEYSDMIFLLEVLLEEYSLQTSEEVLELISFNNFVLKINGSYDEERLKNYLRDRTGYFFLLT
jgi:bacterioferritin-associated ferredoxin